MNCTKTQIDAQDGLFSPNATASKTTSRGFDTFENAWQARSGRGPWRLSSTSDETDDVTVKVRGVRMRDVAIIDLRNTSAVVASRTPCCAEGLVQLYVVRRGALTLEEQPDRTVSAGRFLLRHVGPAPVFKTAPHTTAKFLFLPPAVLAPLLGDRLVTGTADSAEMRLLLAHTNMVHATMADLGPAGAHAARITMIELAKAVVSRRLDAAEPQLAPALVQAAKDIADSRLDQPELSPSLLARELNVSVRTLHRAFAATGESVTAHIRHRRLDEARLALTASSAQPSISELAAHWQFADSSHFTRAFKQRFGRTPTDYARSTRPIEH
jgi:AraC-like DNA-binding protein